MVLVVAISAGCSLLGRSRPIVVEGGDSQRGKDTIGRYGCGSCHTIQGISGARGRVGPPLTGIGERAVVGGVLPNNPENMIRWIQNPHAVDDKAAMPNLGISRREAADIASYLYESK